MSNLNHLNSLFSNQHGFSSKLSCETQLILFVQDLSDTLSEVGQIGLIVMDFSKAFDKIDHQQLLLKLHRIGINCSVVKWISSFLSNRFQLVVLDGVESDSSSLVWCSPRLCFWTLSIVYLYERL